MTTAKLREYIKRVKPRRVITCGGDDNAELYLYESKPTLFALFSRVDSIASADLLKHLRIELNGR